MCCMPCGVSYSLNRMATGNKATTINSENKLPLVKVVTGAFPMPCWYLATLLRALMFPVFILSATGLLWLYLASEWHYLLSRSLYVVHGVFFTILAV